MIALISPQVTITSPESVPERRQQVLQPVQAKPTDRTCPARASGEFMVQKA